MADAAVELELGATRVAFEVAFPHLPLVALACQNLERPLATTGWAAQELAGEAWLHGLVTVGDPSWNSAYATRARRSSGTASVEGAILLGFAISVRNRSSASIRCGHA